MTTRAKFYVSGLELLPGQGAGVRLKLQAVSRGDRNSDWATATPSGSMEMMIQNPRAVAWWEEFVQASRRTGKQPELYVDIAPSEDGWPGDGHAFSPSTGDPGTIYGPDKCAECGLTKDQELADYEWSDKEHRSVKVDSSVRPSHPNG